MTEHKDYAKEQAQAQLDSIVAMIKRVKHIEECTDYTDCELTDQEMAESLNLSLLESESLTDEDRERYHDEDDAQEEIQNDPLGIRIRQDWHSPGSDNQSTEYEILLCTGGPAVRIIGDLNAYSEPKTAEIQFQDWGTPWTNLPTDSEEENALLEYARYFYFAE